MPKFQGSGVVAIALVALLLSGCSVKEDVEHERRANLNSAVNEFDPGSIGPTSCNVAGGSIEPQRGFTRLIVFEGADLWQAVADRFTDLSYKGTASDPYLTMSRKDGIIVAGRLINSPEDQPDLTPELLAKGCKIPTEGAVMVQFEERAVPIGGN